MEVDVKIKRYMAASMRAALDQVRAEQGPDAVILSSRRVSEGVEVIAAIDYDEALIAGARAASGYAQAASAAAQASPSPVAAVSPRAAPVPASRPKAGVARPVASQAPSSAPAPHPVQRRAPS